ncbi:MAG: DUF859 family phage minor structural protein [Bacilli bacterium]|nr:DUF859 family phage minor structural protein [Bacilli bacterium]
MAVNISATQSETSYNVANNNSQVRVIVTATTTGESFNNNSITSTITIDGTKYTVTHKLPKKTTTTIFDKTLTITHGSDGKKNVVTTYSVPTGISAGTLTGNAAPNPLILTATPRASVLSNVTVSIASNGTTTITPIITKYVISYYDCLDLQYGNTIITINGVSSGKAITLSSTQLADLWKAFGNNTVIGVACQLTTKTSSSGSVIGKSAIKSATATLPSYKLQGTYSVQDSIATYDKFKPTTNTDKYLILNLSKPRITFDVGSSTGTTYGNSIVTKVNGVKATSPYTIDDFANTNYIVSATDGRKDKEISFNPFDSYTIIPYQKPSVVALTLVRTSPTSNTATLKVRLKYHNYKGLNTANKKVFAYTVSLKEAGTTTNITFAQSGWTVTENQNEDANGMKIATWERTVTLKSYKNSVTYGITGTDFLGVAFSKSNLILPQGLPLWNGFMYDNKQHMRVNGYLIADEGIRIPASKGIKNGNEKQFLRNNGAATVLSAVNDIIYFRPIADDNSDIQAYFHKDGYFWAPRFISSIFLRIPKNGTEGYGLVNSDNVSIIRDYNNQNVTVDATGGVLYLGHSHTTGLNFLNKATMDADGNMIAPNITAMAKNNVLWSGTYYMTATHTITLSQKVSEQTNGIVLVWSRYVPSESKAYNDSWSFTFIPKSWVGGQNGQGVSCFCSGAAFGPVGCKYVYVKDQQIVGNDANNQSGTKNGITYANNSFVLRYVIGV